MKRNPRFLFFIPLAILGVFLFGEVVMLLWNNVMVPVLHVSSISFWQALGMLILSKILFGGFGGRGGRGNYYRKQRMMWSNMTPEQKEKFKSEWRNRRCGRTQEHADEQSSSYDSV